MSMTHDYLDYLNEKVGIAPANSQEELQAAQVITRLMEQHDVEVGMEEFEAPAFAGLGAAVLAIVMFLGILVSGFGMLALAFLGFVLAAIPTALGLMRLFGHEVSPSFGPSAQSQNVVAVHRATGPLVTKGNRIIVVVAHYDTPRENFLLTTPVAPYLPLVSKLTVPCRYVVAVCALLQLMGFIPSVARIVIWVIGIIAALPALLLAVGSIAERMSSCTLGANDNKSGVAALLGVLENVRPSGLVPRERPVVSAEALDEEPVAAEEAEEKAGSTADLAIHEEVLGTRHGEETLRSLGILPENCEIEYVSAPAPAPVEDEKTRAMPLPVELDDAEPEAGDLETVEAEDAAEAEQLSEAAIEEEVDEILAAPVAEVADEPEVEPEAEAESEAAPEAGATRADILSTGRFSLVMDDGSRGIGPKDTSGLTNVTDDYDPEATRPAPKAPKPDAPADPEWGKSSYRPRLSSVARRASLFDLPDPSENEVDPFATDPHATKVRPAEEKAPEAQPAPAVAVEDKVAEEPRTKKKPETAQAPEPISTISSDRAEKAKSKKSLFGGLFDRLKKSMKSDDEGGEDAGWLGDDSSSDEDGLWRGGAAPRAGLRLVEDDEVPSEGELRDAVLSLGDDALVSHDIWFVALGGSSLDHSGMRDFLARHRSEIRGCFVVNLDCVGAGTLTLLKSEGLESTRRADRRIARLLSGAAADLHVELDQKPCDWQTTDATPAMRSSLRSLTIRGVDANGMPALSHTPADVPENVSGDQVTRVTEIVTEMIRRS